MSSFSEGKVSESEKDFQNQKKFQLKLLFPSIAFLGFGASLVFIIYSALHQDIWALVFCILSLLLLIASIFCYKKLSHYLQIPIFLQVTTMMVGILIYSLNRQPDNMGISGFYSGAAFGLGFTIIYNSIMEWKMILGMHTAIFITMAIISASQNLPEFYVFLIMNIACGVFAWFRFRADTVTFANCFNILKHYEKLSYLLEEHLPIGLLILDQSKDIIYKNQTFIKLFENILNPEGNKIAPILKYLKLDKKAKETVNESSEYTIEHNGHSSNTRDDLNLIVEDYTRQNFNDRMNLTMTFQDMNKTKRLFEVTLSRIEWGKEARMCMFFNDITKQEDMFHTRTSEERKNKILSSISHELRTPLNGIMGSIQDIQSKTNNAEILSSLNICMNCAKLQLSIIDGLMDLAALRNKSFSLKKAKINIEKFMNDLKAIFDLPCKDKNLAFDVVIHKDVPVYIITDRERLLQVFINLLTNAVKFTKEGGIMILVELDPKDSGQIVFKVRDTGSGIKEKVQKKLFKLQTDGTINDTGPGLGLTISNSLVKEMNGGTRIDFQTQAGKGTTFTFKLPKMGLKHIVTDPSNMDSSVELSPVSKKARELETYIESPSKTVWNSRPKINFSSTNDPTLLSVAVLGDQRVHIDLRQTQQQQHSLLMIPSSNNLTVSTPTNIHIPQMSAPGFGCRSSNELQVPGLPGSQNPYFFSQTNFSDAVKKCVLVVDDNTYNLHVARALLKAFDLEVLTSTNGEVALKDIEMHMNQKRDIIFILMDLQMPVMDGYECAKRLRNMKSQGKIPDIPIIALSGNNAPEDVQLCLDVGMEEHITKPLMKQHIKDLYEKYGSGGNTKR